MQFTNRMKPSGSLPLRRRPGLVVELPPGRVSPLVLDGHEGLAAVVAHEPGGSREAEPLALPLLHLHRAFFRKRARMTAASTGTAAAAATVAAAAVVCRRYICSFLFAR